MITEWKSIVRDRLDNNPVDMYWWVFDPCEDEWSALTIKRQANRLSILSEKDSYFLTGLLLCRVVFRFDTIKTKEFDNAVISGKVNELTRLIEEATERCINYSWKGFIAWTGKQVSTVMQVAQ